MRIVIKIVVVIGFLTHSALIFSAALKEDYVTRCRIAVKALAQYTQFPDGVSDLVMGYHGMPLGLSFQQDLPVHYADGFVCSLPAGQLAIIARNGTKRVVDAKSGDVIGKIIRAKEPLEIEHVQMLPDGRCVYALKGGMLKVLQEGANDIEVATRQKTIASLAMVSDGQKSELAVCGTSAFSMFDTRPWQEGFKQKRWNVIDTDGVVGFTAAARGKQVFFNSVGGMQQSASWDGSDIWKFCYKISRYDMDTKNIDTLIRYDSPDAWKHLALCGNNIAIAKVEKKGKNVLDIYDPERKVTVLSQAIEEPILAVVPIAVGVALHTRIHHDGGRVRIVGECGELLQELPSYHGERLYPIPGGGLALLTQHGKNAGIAVYRPMTLQELLDNHPEES